MDELGTGVRLDTYAFEDRELPDAIDRLLADAPLRERMAAEGAAIRSRDGVTKAADLIEALGRTGR
jgi:UDP:flavonoid glycosyltransferase YjiC (YdhE family)